MNPAHFSFYLVETSPYHRQMQKQRLAPLAVQIEWKENLPELPRFPYSIIYSNELIDAFPVHRIKRTGKFLYEGYVTIAKDALSFIEKWGPLSTPLLGEMIEYLQVHLYEEHVMELNLAAYKWIHEVAQWMDKGFLLTIDYGARSKELLLRKNGTLRCYQNHQLIDNPYHMPGELDLTSHVNFEFLEKWGEECGLKPVTYQTQSRFLLEWGILDLIPKQPVCHPFSPEAKQGRAIQQLIHPYGMGEVFQVLLQAKGLEYSFLPHSFL
jgi:SAM-dependent MidA family methyltransferase